MAPANSTAVPLNRNTLFTLNSKTSSSLFFSHSNSLSAFSSSIFSSSSQLHLHSQPSHPYIRITRVSTTPVEYAPPAPEFNFQKEIARLKSLKSKLDGCETLKDKINVVESDSRVKSSFDSRSQFARVLEGENLNEFELYLLKCVVAAGQGHVLGELDSQLEGAEVDSARSSVKSAFYALAEMIETWDVNGGGRRQELKGEGRRAFRSLLKTLGDVEQFYDCIGGIIGYQTVVLELLAQSTSGGQAINWVELTNKSLKHRLIEIHPPNVLDLSEDVEYASQAALWGIEGLPDLGEIYPLGGSADRLGLVDPETSECLPAAMLPYCGRTLLEGLIRDLQAREFLYFKLCGKQCITPVAIMTSSAKNNHWHILTLCERLKWFGRGRSRFQLFEQPLVPAVTAEDGEWVVTRPYVPLCKPGGHGVIWKLAYDKGVFKWFHDHGRKGATVRQVSNVVAATDMTLLALAGIGLRHRKKLGFASCQRNPGATEGINVLLEKKNLDGKWAYGLSCIEYTEFDKFGITVGPPSPNSLQEEFPANTNILYVDLPSAELIGSSKDARSLPGMVLNVKKPITFVDEFGIKRSISGGRLECTMQNIADNFTNTYPSRCYKDVEDELDTFIVYNERRKVTSSAKKKRRHADKSFHQTPDGSLLDIMRNAYDLLSHCGIKMPKVEGNDKYLNSGPPYLILLHPALGPLWEVTRQKFQGGSIATGSELQLEIAEFLWSDVQLDGSLIILAENVIGSSIIGGTGEPILQYGRRCARCKLQNVRIVNSGINWNSKENIYWKHNVQRFQALKVILHGNAEFEAIDVVIQGNHVFEVPDGYKLKITSGDSGLEVEMKLIDKELMDTGTWFWNYTISGQHIQLSLNEF